MNRILICLLVVSTCSASFLQAADKEIKTTIFWYLENGSTMPTGSTPLHLYDPAFEVTFTLPSDCSKLDSYYNQYGANTDMTNLRRIDWALGYCRKQAILATGEKAAQHDYVSSIDFSRLPLDWIPYNVRCEGMSGDEWFKFCDRVKREDQTLCYGGQCDFPLSIPRFIIEPPAGITPPDTDSSWMLYQGFTSIDNDSCSLRDSVFLGSITVTKQGKVVCTHDPEGSGIRLDVVGFRDVNQDSNMDVVLQVCQTSYDTLETGCHEFVLTKKGADSSPEWLAKETR